MDEALHSCMSKPLMNLSLAHKGNVLVMATDGGNTLEQTNDFPTIANFAAEMGWRVVVCGWKANISNSLRKVQEKHPGAVELRFVEDIFR